MKRYCHFILVSFLIEIPLIAAADQLPTAKETVVLQRVQVEGTDREMGLGIAEFPPNASKPRHKATGPEVGYVLSGEVTVKVDGQPTRIVRAGESYRMPAGDPKLTTVGRDIPSIPVKYHCKI